MRDRARLPTRAPLQHHASGQDDISAVDMATGRLRLRLCSMASAAEQGHSELRRATRNPEASPSAHVVWALEGISIAVADARHPAVRLSSYRHST